MTNTPSSPATALIATDLDRTMIYSRGAMGEDRFAEGGLLCVEYYEGVPLSYVSEAAAIRLRGLASALPWYPPPPAHLPSSTGSISPEAVALCDHKQRGRDPRRR